MGGQEAAHFCFTQASLNNRPKIWYNFIVSIAKNGFPEKRRKKFSKAKI
jgi:hypothetical protein